MTDTNTYSAADELAAERARAWLGAGNTRAALARAAGISAGVVSQILGGTYPSPPGEHLEAMSAAIERAGERLASPADIPYVETSVAAGVRGVCRRAHNDRDIGLYAGRVGIGKTVAAQRYAADNRGALFLEAYPGAGAPVLLRLLAERLGAQARRRTVADTTAACVDALRGADRVILVDEAETLTDQALLHLRRVSDSAEIGVVLIGTPALMGLVSDDGGKFGQISSRIGFWPPIARSITEEDARALALAYLGEAPAADVQAALWAACRGSARALRNVLRNSARWCRRRGRPLDAGVVREVDLRAMGGRRLAA